MRNKKLYLITLVVLVLAAVMLQPAQAQPPLPSSFNGEVHFQLTDGTPALGDFLEAWVPGMASYASRAAIKDYPIGSGNLVYSIDVPGDDLDTVGKDGGIEGELVTFKIGGRIISTATWHGGTSTVVHLHPPMANTGGPYVGLVSEAISLSASRTDWLSSDTFTYAWDLDNNGSYETGGQYPSPVFSTVGTKTVGLKVTDGSGGEGFASTQVVVVQLVGLSGQVYNGTQRSLTVSGLQSPYTYSVTYNGSATAPTNAGTYEVVVRIWNGTTLVGTLTRSMVIAPLPVTVTANSAQSKVFGSADPVLAYTASTVSPAPTFSGALSRVSGENVGSYAIIQNTLSAGTNYSITFVSASFSITPKPVTISVTSGQSKVYGSANPVYTYTCSDPAVTFSGALSRTAGENVGSYPINIGTLAVVGSNYSIATFNPQNFTIIPKPLTITVTPGQSKLVGTADPVFAYTSSDPAASFSGALARTAGEEIGSYPINSGTLAVVGSNYTITSFVPANFTIIGVQYSTGLVVGWNLVSFNIHPVDTSLSAVLASLAGNYDLVYAWDATGGHTGDGNWMKADNIPISTDSLLNLDETQGFWIHMTAADSLVIIGQAVPTSTSISLRNDVGGWNLVAFPSSDPVATASAVSSLGTSYTLIYTYDVQDTADPWKLYDRSGAPYANDLVNMSPGLGYWIFVTADVTWTVPY